MAGFRHLRHIEDDDDYSIYDYDYNDYDDNNNDYDGYDDNGYNNENLFFTDDICCPIICETLDIINSKDNILQSGEETYKNVLNRIYKDYSGCGEESKKSTRYLSGEEAQLLEDYFWGIGECFKSNLFCFKIINSEDKDIYEDYREYGGIED